jgi:hypothetical protein
MNVLGDLAPARQQMNIEKTRELITKTIIEQSMSLQSLLGSIISFPRDLNRKFEHVKCEKIDEIAVYIP